MRHRRYIHPRTCLILIAIMLIGFAVSFIVSQAYIKRAENRASELAQTYSDLLGAQAELSERLAYVQTDDYVIQTARDELSLIMPDEVRYIAG